MLNYPRFALENEVDTILSDLMNYGLSDIYSKHFDVDDFVKEVSEHYTAAYGATRIVVKAKGDYVIKFQYGRPDADVDYGARELSLYEAAMAAGYNECLADTVEVFPKGHMVGKFVLPYGVYATEACECDYYKVEESNMAYLTSIVEKESGVSVAEMMRINSIDYASGRNATYTEVYSLDEAGTSDREIEEIASIYGYDLCDFFDFLTNNLEVPDVHSANCGFNKDGHLVIVDYAGYLGGCGFSSCSGSFSS